MEPYNVLFLCTGNSAGIVMAEALLNHWGHGNESSGPGAPKLDFVFTVCGNAAKEQCPYWPGQPMTAHWGVDDPPAVEGTREGQVRSFNRALRELDARIKLFVRLPIESLDKVALTEKLQAIGRTPSQKE